MSASSAVTRWRDSPACAVEALAGVRAVGNRAVYRLGDACLDVTSDYAPFLEAVEACYGDCLLRSASPGVPSIVCRVALLPGSSLLAVELEGVAVPELLEITRISFRTLKDRVSYVETAGPVDGWRQLVDIASGDRPLVASCPSMALLDIEQEGLSFWVRQLASAVQRAQRHMLFLHAASVVVDGSGALLIAPTHGGKSTTALALAWRGHTLLSDDVAAVRQRTRQILPYRESVGVRTTPLPVELLHRLTGCPHVVEESSDGTTRQLVRTEQLFPSTREEAATLRFAFVLERFAPSAAARPFRPGPSETPRLRVLSGGMLPTWGATPARHVMTFLRAMQLLSELQCFLVDVGEPAATAEVIERVIGAA